MSTSSGAWERTAIIFLAVFTVGVVTASYDEEPTYEEPTSVQSGSTGKVETNPSDSLGG